MKCDGVVVVCADVRWVGPKSLLAYCWMCVRIGSLAVGT